MKHLQKICTIMMIGILAASLAYTAHELCVTRAKLVAAELTANHITNAKIHMMEGLNHG